MGRNLACCWIPALSALRLHDLESLVVFDIPQVDAHRVATWLDGCARHPVIDDHVVGAETWHARPLEDHLELVRSMGGEAFEVVALPRDRLAVWAASIRRLLDDLTRSGVIDARFEGRDRRSMAPRHQ
ncbi:MAG: hypothetical protein F9K40_00070 [Kofleriaceae bacterium]|nr:MAG: hypothetical protein F9K40_00070 [Kofleriaceae bacterium]